MAISNKDRISRALDYVRDGLTPFAEREFEARLGSYWQARVNDNRQHGIPSDKDGSFGLGKPGASADHVQVLERGFQILHRSFGAVFCQ